MAEKKSNFARLILSVCAEENIEAASFSQDWCFRLRRDGRTSYITGYQFALNPASAKELAQDKALTYEVLTDSGIPAAVHLFLPAFTPEAEKTFPYEKEFRSVIEGVGEAVIKDNYGTGGNQVFRVKDGESFLKRLKAIWSGSYAASLSPFYEIEEEYRIVVLDGEPRLFIRKERASVVGNGTDSMESLVRASFNAEEPDPRSPLALLSEAERARIPEAGEKVFLNWKHNLGQGALGVEVTDEALQQELSAIAVPAQKALGLRFCSVDVVRCSGSYMVLEVNGGVMMEHFSGQNDHCFAKAKAIYRDAILKMMEK